MTKSSFSDLLVAIKRHWTSRDGLVVLLEKANPAKPGCRLCVPGMQPSTLVPELCILWKDDEAIYKGRLDSHELRCKLTDEGAQPCAPHLLQHGKLEHLRQDFRSRVHRDLRADSPAAQLIVL